MYQQDQLQFPVDFDSNSKLHKSDFVTEEGLLGSRPTSQSHSQLGAIIWAWKRRAPVARLNSTRHDECGAPSKEVFSCCSGLHWISSVVGFFTFPFANLARHKSFNTNGRDPHLQVPFNRADFHSLSRTAQLLHTCLYSWLMQAKHQTATWGKNYFDWPSKPYK